MFDHTTYTYIRKSNDIIWNKCTHSCLYTLNTNEIQNFALKIDDLTPIFKNSFFMFKKCIDICTYIFSLKKIYTYLYLTNAAIFRDFSTLSMIYPGGHFWQSTLLFTGWPIIVSLLLKRVSASSHEPSVCITKTRTRDPPFCRFVLNWLSKRRWRYYVI